MHGKQETAAGRIARLVDEHQHALRRMCYLYLRDEQDAEDAVQETFLRAMRSLERYRGECSEKTWLVTLAVNICRDMRRSAWFRHTEKRITPEELPLAAPPADDSALALAQAIAHLPDRLRDPVVLYYYHDMTMLETAQALHAAPSTIAKRLAQARERLAAEMKGGEWDA